MKYLVTGGAGFIGSSIVEALSGVGEVDVIDDLSSGNLNNIKALATKDGVKFHQKDVRDLSSIKPVFRGVDYVFHLAALADVTSSVRDPVRCNEVNVDGTLNVLLAARDQGVKKMVFSSSSAVYGDAAEMPAREDSAVDPKSPYAVSKIAGEHYCKIFSELYGLKTVSLRYFNVYGPRQNPDSQYAAVIPVFISKLLRGEQPVIYGDGGQTRDFIYVADVARANMIAAQSDVEGVYNIASGTPTSINTLYRVISKKIGTDVEPQYEERRPGDVKDSYADLSKTMNALHFKPAIKLEEGLSLTIRAYAEPSRKTRSKAQ